MIDKLFTRALSRLQFAKTEENNASRPSQNDAQMDRLFRAVCRFDRACCRTRCSLQKPPKQRIDCERNGYLGIKPVQIAAASIDRIPVDGPLKPCADFTIRSERSLR